MPTRGQDRRAIVFAMSPEVEDSIQSVGRNLGVSSLSSPPMIAIVDVKFISILSFPLSSTSIGTVSQLQVSGSEKSVRVESSLLLNSD